MVVVRDRGTLNCGNVMTNGANKCKQEKACPKPDEKTSNLRELLWDLKEHEWGLQHGGKR